MPHSLTDDLIPGVAFKKPSIIQLKDPSYESKQVKVSMLRLDEIHAVISGNKLFKLYYFLKEAKHSAHKTIITFGGTFSNHLAATAFAANKSNLKCIGVVRGERPSILSPTLVFCLKQKMQLEFVPRSVYKESGGQDFLQKLYSDHKNFILIPEGGFSPKGAKGAELIPYYFELTDYTHVCLAVGTATTFAGIINGVKDNVETIGFSALKNMSDIDTRLDELGVDRKKKFSFVGDYHFGGYAKKTGELINFINDFYFKHGVPLDFVYTGKMMFGVNDLVEKNYFPNGAHILCIHTGGLQGNSSLKNLLAFKTPPDLE
ncbi:MAG TPA: pyridoxal-phosphate dependent enzyme [Hanamia sp.]|nr:pyridoxal-phosphate dependent enzyme [Hanamia sp.]